MLRVRLDVDETDVAKLRVGQPAFVTAEAYGPVKFSGHVIRVGRILGRKNVRTEEPSEHVDTKILETLVQLDPGQMLPLGLRVDSFVFVGEGAEAKPAISSAIAMAVCGSRPWEEAFYMYTREGPMCLHRPMDSPAIS